MQIELPSEQGFFFQATIFRNGRVPIEKVIFKMDSLIRPRFGWSRKVDIYNAYTDFEDPFLRFEVEYESFSKFNLCLKKLKIRGSATG